MVTLRVFHPTLLLEPPASPFYRFRPLQHFTIETSSSTVSFLTLHYPDDWVWDPAKPGKYRAAFEARTKHIKSDYASRGLVIGPDLTQRLDKTLTPLSQSIPSLHPCNQNAWLQTLIQAVKRSGGKIEIKKIPTTDLPKFQPQAYSQYLHPGRPTTKPRDSDIRGIPKINDVFGTDNPVKSSTNIFMTGMIASDLAVRVMPGEELVRTLPSKDLVELTIPMTEEEKQQVQQEEGPKYYWQRGRLTGANAAAEAGISDPSRAFFFLPQRWIRATVLLLAAATCSSTHAPRPLELVGAASTGSESGSSMDVRSNVMSLSMSHSARSQNLHWTLSPKRAKWQ
ncbi:hypothetical protein FNYG_02215 [Fusarium nygamai]|uniref:Uncharacterized protein n=1 Tax=Gibberella nygamai TaxID=42673 RepID=A0A2K0WQP1_GIBNY|nr:hypothetical protein FNYG_02215 [Fusarium nygamai]